MTYLVTSHSVGLGFKCSEAIVAAGLSELAQILSNHVFLRVPNMLSFLLHAVQYRMFTMGSWATVGGRLKKYVPWS